MFILCIYDLYFQLMTDDELQVIINEIEKEQEEARKAKEAAAANLAAQVEQAR